MEGPKTGRSDPKWAGTGPDQTGPAKSPPRENELPRAL